MRGHYDNPNTTNEPIPLRANDLPALADGSCRTCHGAGSHVVLEPQEAVDARRADDVRDLTNGAARVYEQRKARVACKCVRRALRMRDDTSRTASGALLWLPRVVA